MTTRIRVAADQPYEVVVGTRLTQEIARLVGDAARVAVIFAAPLRQHLGTLVDVLRGTGASVIAVEVPDAERAKTVQVAARCWNELVHRGFCRDDVVVSFGGGAVTDLAGFVAARWLCGVRVVHIPTSLLGMVDAAIGGKCGVNTAAGKNTVGAFHSPSGVLCDLALLLTLPTVELTAALAEVARCGFIADLTILDILAGLAPATLRHDESTLRELVERSVRVKAEFVGTDFRESGRRELLNYGHTLAHAIERVEGYRARHGHAVSVGLVYAAAVGRLAGRLDAAGAERHRSLLAGLDLPVSYREDAWDDLLAAMRADKKVRGGRLRFVVLDGLGRPAILDDPEPGLLRAAYEEIAGGIRERSGRFVR